VRKCSILVLLLNSLLNLQNEMIGPYGPIVKFREECDYSSFFSVTSSSSKSKSSSGSGAGVVSIVYPIHIAITMIRTTPSKIGSLTISSGSKRPARTPNVASRHASSPNIGIIAKPMT